MPSQLLIVGDLFHSHANKEMELFLRWRNDLPHLKINLIRGNHDILKKKFYEEANITVEPTRSVINDFCFTHDIDARCEEEKGYFTFSGHVHPGVRISGMGRQALYFPCFHFRKDHAVLPAFSRFTGLVQMERMAGDKVFAIVEKAVIKV